MAAWKKIVTEDDAGNPTAVIAGAAVNGTATTFMRSDAAPELGPLTRDLDFGANKASNLGAPTAPSDATTKAYVDALAQGLAPKESVRVATTTNGTLATAYEDGDTVDGVVIATGDRILIKNQTAGEENGIYTVNAAGAPTRALDADSSGDLLGAFTFVEEGATNADTGWVLTTNAPIVVGTTSLTFTQFSGAGSFVDGAALVKTGNTLDWNPDGSTLEVSGDAARVKPLGITDAHVATANKDGVAGTASLRTLGTGGQQAAAGNDARLSDTRIPSNTNGGTAWDFADNEVVGLRAKGYTTAGLPVAPAVGRIAYDTTVSRLKVYY